MIRFHQYNIQLEPHNTSLELFAPNLNVVEDMVEYKEFIQTNKPREIRIIEHPYWIMDNNENREATLDEISEWIKDDAYLSMENILSFSPNYYLKRFGDEKIMSILKEKITADYNDYNSEWQNRFNENKTELIGNLSEISAVKTVYENLMNCCDGYSQAHIETLSKEEHPLRIAAWFFEKAMIFNVETDAKDIIDIAYRDKDEKEKFYDLELDYSETADHKTKMSLLDKNLDEAFSTYQAEWNELDFNGIKEKCVEIYTMNQLYNTLKNDKVLYDPKHLQVMASIKNPLEFDKFRLVGERELCVCTLDEINKLLPKMYPDLEMEISIFDQAEKDNFKFRIKAGKENEYAELKSHNQNSVAFELAERWGGMLEDKLADGYRLSNIAIDTLAKADKWQTSGAISSFSASILSNYWEQGEEFSKCYFKNYEETTVQSIGEMKGY